jgi:hypothetical protein
MDDLDARIDAAIEASGGQKTDQCHVEPAGDLLEEGRRAKMLRVWDVYVQNGRNVLRTANAFKCSRNTVKLYVRLYQQELDV